MSSAERKRRPSLARRHLIGFCVAVVAVVAAACAPVKPPPEPPPGWIATSPTLFPAFSTDIPDYVAKCDASSPILITVDAPDGTNVSINGMPFQGGQFSTSLTRDVGQSFVIVVQSPTALTTHFVRCLPADFPDWTAQRTGDTQAEWYVMASPFGQDFQSYPTIFDNDGVPVWWSDKTNTYFPTVLPDKNIAWTFQNGSGAEEHALDGSLVRKINTIPSTPPGSDPHDLLLLPNGNYVMVQNVNVPGTDLSACDGSPPGTHIGTLLDHVIQEIQPGPNGAPDTVVGFWDTMTHIPLSEANPDHQFNSICLQGDAYHWNSIEATSDGYILSFRHLDAIYRIKEDPTGQLNNLTTSIEWKLGGSHRAESLTVQPGDPVFDAGGDFGGQHDPRLLSESPLTVSLHDNGTGFNRPPRALRYQIDATNKTATLLDAQQDPLAPSSSCCGSARKLPGGDWVMGWGDGASIPPPNGRVVTEFAPDGTRLFLMQFATGNVYRAVPVLPGVLNRSDLEAGMDTQYGTPPIGTTSAGASSKAHAASPPPPKGSNPQTQQP
jgi:Arylsulfotransferase (ASST)